MKSNIIKTTREGREQMEGILSIAEIVRKKIIICSMAILIVFLWVAISFGSWSTGFGENGIYGGATYNIKKIEVFDLGRTSDFEAPGMYNFTAGLWAVQMPNTNYVLATNATPISNFNWFFSFTGTSADILHLAYLAYASTGKIFGTYIDYSGSSWTVPTIAGFDPNDPAYDHTASSVLHPPAVFLFSSCLLSLVALRKKIPT